MLFESTEFLCENRGGLNLSNSANKLAVYKQILEGVNVHTYPLSVVHLVVQMLFCPTKFALLGSRGQINSRSLKQRVWGGAPQSFFKAVK